LLKGKKEIDVIYFTVFYGFAMHAIEHE